MIEIKGKLNTHDEKFRTDKHLFVNPMHVQSIMMEDGHAILNIKGWELRITLEDVERIVDQMHNFMLPRNPNA